jgi:hypothetical protein
MGVLHEPAGGSVPTVRDATSAAPASVRRPGQPSPRAGTGPATSAPPVAGSRELIRRLERGGLASPEAGNVVAYLLGLKPIASGWRVAEIEHLRFLRALVADGRLES